MCAHTQRFGGPEVGLMGWWVPGSKVKRPGWVCYCNPEVLKLPPLLPHSSPHLLPSLPPFCLLPFSMVFYLFPLSLSLFPPFLLFLGASVPVQPWMFSEYHEIFSITANTFSLCLSPTAPSSVVLQCVCIPWLQSGRLSMGPSPTKRAPTIAGWSIKHVSPTQDLELWVQTIFHNKSFALSFHLNYNGNRRDLVSTVWFIHTDLF